MNGEIVVKTETLIAQSNEVSKQIENTSRCFQELKRLVSGTNSYWIGDGGKTHRSKYTKREKEIDTAIRRLREHVTDLRTMAGVYDTGEHGAQGQAQSLISEVIS